MKVKETPGWKNPREPLPTTNQLLYPTQRRGSTPPRGRQRVRSILCSQVRTQHEFSMTSLSSVDINMVQSYVLCLKTIREMCSKDRMMKIEVKNLAKQNKTKQKTTLIFVLMSLQLRSSGAVCKYKSPCLASRGLDF